MTRQQAEEKLRRAAGGSAAVPWLNGPVRDTSGIDRVEQEHRERMQKLKSDADSRIERQRQHKRDLVAQSKRHRELLREESMEKRRQEDRVELASRRDMRDFMEAIGGSLSEFDRRHLQDELEEANCTPNDPQVVRVRKALECEWAKAGLDVRVCADPLLRNGVASREGGYVEIAPISSLIMGEIAYHETGHCLHAPLADDRFVPGEFGKRVSVPRELAAWRWTLDRIPVWTEAMHAVHGALPEVVPSRTRSRLRRRQMDDLCGAGTMRLTQLRIQKDN